MGLIGFSVGILGFLLHQIIDLISEVKWEQTKEYISNGEFSTALMWTFCYSLVFLVVSTLLVVYQPAAAGSGIPEIIGFLNGTRIPDIFKVRFLKRNNKSEFTTSLLPLIFIFVNSSPKPILISIQCAKAIQKA